MSRGVVSRLIEGVPWMLCGAPSRGWGSAPLIVVFFVVMAAGSTKVVWGQTAQSAPDEDARLQPAEPDFTLIDLPTTLRLPLHKGHFRLTHRFQGNLRDGGFKRQARDLFGLDNGAAIGLEFRYAVARHIQAAIYRTSIDKVIQMYGKYDPIRQSESVPVSFSAVVSVEGSNNFRKRRLPAVGAVVSRMLKDRTAFYMAPIWAHNTAAEAAITRDTFLLGLGGRVRVGDTTYFAAELSPRAAGYAPGEPGFGFALEKRVGGHVFQLNVTNTLSTTFGQIARGGFPKTLYLGFNLTRKFY